jgi:hypothetical protein
MIFLFISLPIRKRVTTGAKEPTQNNVLLQLAHLHTIYDLLTKIVLHENYLRRLLLSPSGSKDFTTRVETTSGLQAHNV